MHQRTSYSSRSPRAPQRLARLAALAAATSLAGCDGQALNLGEDAPGAGAEASTCSVDASTVSTFVATQAELEALRGCRELPGNLFITWPEESGEALSLEPLAELERVHGLLSIVGPFPSLAGLEALRQVVGLQLSYLLAPDLTPLRGLTTVIREPNYARLAGGIRIEECEQLTDLRGLENVTVWSSLALGGLDNLTTLEGLHVPPRADEVAIAGAPLLSDASALAPLEELGALTLSGTAVASFSGFQLQRAESINVSGNPALTDLDGLGELARVGSMLIEDNDELRRVELPSLDDFEAISIVGNAVLEAVPLYPATQGESYWPIGDTKPLPLPRMMRDVFEVGDNPQLTTIQMPTAYTDIEHVAIHANASLISLDMVNMSQASSLLIRDNPALSSVNAGQLARVADLAIVNNPALSVAPFADVQTFSRELSGNLDELAP